MGKVTWGGGLDGKTIDKADRSQFRPYAGPKVPKGVYCWRIKNLKRGKSSNKNDQVIVGLELVPRESRPDERAYAGFYVTDYLTLTEAAAWRVAGFTDAIGVTGSDLINKTKDSGEKDSKGSVPIVSIGDYKQTGKVLILAAIEDDTDPKSKSDVKVSGYWSPEALKQGVDEDADDEEDEDDDDESDDEDDDDSDDEDEDDEDDEDEDDEPEPEPVKKGKAKKKAEPEPVKKKAKSKEEPPAKAKKGKTKSKAADDEDEDAPF